MGNYSTTWFQRQAVGATTSAQRVVPLVLERYHPCSVVDVGCGTGVWLQQFIAAGIVDVLGLDGAYIKRESLRIPEEKFLPVDLSREIPDVGRTFELAICLEVAEHLPATHAAVFVRRLTELAPVVVFSAAIPFQGGTNHVNEQWPDYWVKMFGEHGFGPCDSMRWELWDDHTIEPWYRQNIIVFERDKNVGKTVPAVVHPQVFTANFETGPGLLWLLSHLPSAAKRAVVTRMREPRAEGPEARSSEESTTVAAPNLK